MPASPPPPPVHPPSAGRAQPDGRTARPSARMAALQRMAGQVAHDLNNYLTAILGYGELVQMASGKEPRLQSYVREMLRAGERAAAFARQLQAFSGRQVLDLGTRDVATWLEGLRPRLEEVVGEGVEVVLAVADGIGSVEMDAAQLDHVLLVLAEEAREAMAGVGVLRIEARKGTLGDGAPGLQLRVADTSAASAGVDTERAFEPFPPPGRNGIANGMGLASAYGIVMQHGGSIAVGPAPAGGRCFTIGLRAAA